MKKLLFVFIYFCMNYAASSQAPLCIENWEGHSTFSEFLFEEPPGTVITGGGIVNGAFALEGDRARSIMWDLRQGHYFGWGIDLTQGAPNGFTATNVKAISFKIKLGTGEEKFRLNIKDTRGIQPGINSIAFLDRSTEVQSVRIEMRRFGSAVNLASLRDINFQFDRATASMMGNMVIDDFRFEYE